MIRPLDLQTLYMNLDKVSKELAQSKESQVLAQSHQVQKLAKEHDQNQHAVRKASAPAETEAEGKVQADGRQAGGGGAPSSRSPSGKPEDEAQKDGEEPFKDPQLGRHIDLSG